MTPPAPRRHILTVNLEDYYQVGAFNKYVQRNRWRRFESRVEVGTARTLELLAKHGATATFFVLGWVADEYPELMRTVAAAGHEIGVRGYYHRGIRDMTPEEFGADADRARAAVEQATGRTVIGYRLADGWLGEDDLWALGVLADLGFEYDSSLAPIRRAFADDPARRFPHVHEHGDRQIVELPVSCGTMLGVRLPVGGNYLRQFPGWVTRRAAARWVRSQTAPLVAYFHTWEMDADQPRLTAGGRFTRLRHYRNLASMPDRVAALLAAYPFGSCAELLGAEPEPAPPRPAVVPLMAAPRPVAADGPRLPVSVVVPCYNEEQILPYLRKTLAEVADHLSDRYDVRFILVDDGSSDATWLGLQTGFSDNPAYTLLRHDRNRGVAAAIMTGIRGSNTEVVCSMDSDCSYDPLKLADLIPHLTPGVDLVTASPYHPAGGVKNVPGWRLWLSKGCAWLYRRVLRAKLHTYTSCFRVYRRSTVAILPLRHNRYLGVAELLGRLSIEGGTVVEVPAVLEARMHGRSKMKTVRTVIGHLGLMTRLLFARRHPASTADRDQVIRGQLSMIRRATAPDLDPTPALSAAPGRPPAPSRIARPGPPVTSTHP
jgi:polysaccharide deacetylase family protein (PEP-CTERM system associated)